MEDKVIRKFIEIVDADCKQFGGIIDVTYDNEINKCSIDDLKAIRKALLKSAEYIEEEIIDRKVHDVYDKGFQDGASTMLESFEEPLM